MKIDDGKPGSLDIRRPATRGAGATLPETGAMPAAPSAGPAVNVSLGSGANVSVTVVAGDTAGVDDLSDVELLDKLRERIDQGEFEVDYTKLARSVLDEAIAAAKRRGE